MEKFAEAFVRNPDGSWFCRAPVHFTGPQGPLTTTPGATYRRGHPLNGYDIARMLDDWYNARVPPIGIRFY
jgi:hypothetical protein